MTASSLHLPTQLDPAIEARMLVAQAGGTRVSRGWTIGATADIGRSAVRARRTALA